MIDTYEEKYKEANDKVAARFGTNVAKEIFADLYESEDEKIRKELIDFLKDWNTLSTKKFIAWLKRQDEEKPVISNDALIEGIAHFGITQYQIDNWLKKYVDVEKQGEQKTANEVEQKFKVGDWIVSSVLGIAHIIGVNDSNKYQLEYIDGEQKFSSIDYVNYEYDEWTIQDAKDGDVLATSDYILIFEKIFSKNYGVSHCHYGFGNTTPQFNFNKDDNWYFGKEANVYPATKEERDILFEKMKEAGYEWDAEKKELKKIEHKLA